MDKEARRTRIVVPQRARHIARRAQVLGRLTACRLRMTTHIFMSQAAQAITRAPADVVREAPVSQAPNGICYAVAGEMSISATELERMISAVPKAISAALERKAYYFVPLTVNQGDQTVIADRYDVALSDSAVCHRNLELGGSQCVFISTRLMDDKFSVAFEFYINVGHAFVERAGVSQEFADLVAYVENLKDQPIHASGK